MIRFGHRIILFRFDLTVLPVGEHADRVLRTLSEKNSRVQDRSRLNDLADLDQIVRGFRVILLFRNFQIQMDIVYSVFLIEIRLIAKYCGRRYFGKLLHEIRDRGILRKTGLYGHKKLSVNVGHKMSSGAVGYVKTSGAVGHKMLSCLEGRIVEIFFRLCLQFLHRIPGMIDDRAQQIQDPPIAGIPCTAADPGIILVQDQMPVLYRAPGITSADRFAPHQIDDRITAAQKLHFAGHRVNGILASCGHRQIQRQVTAFESDNFGFIKSAFKVDLPGPRSQIEGRIILQDRDNVFIDMIRQCLHCDRSLQSLNLSDTIWHSQRVHSAAKTIQQLCPFSALHISVILIKREGHTVNFLSKAWPGGRFFKFCLGGCFFKLCPSGRFFSPCLGTRFFKPVRRV